MTRKQRRKEQRQKDKQDAIAYALANERVRRISPISYDCIISGECCGSEIGRFTPIKFDTPIFFSSRNYEQLLNTLQGAINDTTGLKNN